MSRRKKIAIVVPDLSYYGGVPAVAKFLYEIINESKEFEADYVSIATSSKDSDSRRILKPATWFNEPKVSLRRFEGVEYRHVGANWTEIEMFRYRPRKVLDKILNEYDLIQVVAGTPAWTLVTQKVNKPVVLQVATLASVERESRVKSMGFPKNMWAKLMVYLNTRAEKKAVRVANTVLVENVRLFNVLKTQPDVVFATPGVDTDFFCLNRVEKENFILSVGRFDDVRKNVRLLFEAFSYFKKETGAGVKLVLAGKTSPTASDFEFAERFGILADIKVLKDVSREILRDLYQKAAFFTLSSDEEGLGLVLLEASACGLPIIATKCGGAEEIVVEGETGFLVPIKNARALAEKMAKLWHNPKLRAEMGENARKRTVEVFSKEATGKAFLKVYREHLAKRK